MSNVIDYIMFAMNKLLIFTNAMVIYSATVNNNTYTVTVWNLILTMIIVGFVSYVIRRLI